MSHDTYRSPLAERYASQAMLTLFSPQTRHGLWRRLWLALAESERELGIAIPEEALVQMRAHLDDIDFAASAAVPLTTLRQPKYELGAAAARMVISEFTNPASHAHQRVRFQPQLVVRDSTGPCPPLAHT